MTHKNDGFIENLLKVPAPLNLNSLDLYWLYREEILKVYVI